MKALYILTFFFLISIASYTQTNTWTGTTSRSWHTGSNWSLGHVPTLSEDVIIPSGTTYSPLITTFADCSDLTIQSGADLEMSTPALAYPLEVHDDMTIYGSLTISTDDCDIRVHDNIIWKSGSTIINNYIYTVTYPYFFVDGNWTFEAGSNAVFDKIGTFLGGTTDSYIYNYSSTSSFWILDIRPESASIIFSGLSTYDLKITSVFGIGLSGIVSTFVSNSSQDIVVGSDGSAAFRNHYGSLQLNNGELIIHSTYYENIVFNAGDYVNDLEINMNSPGVQVISSDLQVNGDLTVNGDETEFTGTVTLFGHLTNSLTDISELLFNNIRFEGGAFQSIFNGFDCDQFILDKSGSYLQQLNQTITCDHYDWVNGEINVLGGTFTADDLIDNGIYGSFWVTTGGTINLTNNDGFIDLNGEINISGSGTMNIFGGSTDSYWAFGDDCTLNMSGGVLDFKDQGIDLDDNHTLTENITGGVIRTEEGFNGTQRSDFNPVGGAFEFYGISDFSINQGSGNSFHSVEINKDVAASPGPPVASAMSAIPPDHQDPVPESTLSNTIVLASDLHLTGDMLISSGNLDVSTNNWRIYLAGDWTNNVGDAGFIERQGFVEFEGSSISQILTDETFYNLVEDKTSTSFRALELGSGDGNGVDVNVLGTLAIADGNMELNAPCTLSIGYRLDIYDGSTLNANDAGTMQIKMAGDTWFDHNTSTSGFSRGSSSVVEFNGTNPASTQGIIENAPFNDILINSDAMEVKINSSGPSLGGLLNCQDMVIQKGSFNPGGHTVTIANSLTVHGMLEMSHADDTINVNDVVWKSGSGDIVSDGIIIVSDDWTWESGTGAVFDPGNTVEFIGGTASLIKCQDDDASFGTLDINKPSGPSADTYIYGASTDAMRVAGDMTVRAGNQFHLQGEELQVGGSLVNEAGCEIDMSSGALLEVNDFLSINGSLDVDAGSVLVHDFFDLETTGQLIIDGGSMVSDVLFGAPYWCNFAGSLTISGGILETTNTNQRYESTFSGTISDGTFRVGGAFKAYASTFQPSGGTVEFIFGGGHYIELSSGCWFHNLTFNNSGIRDLNSTMTVKNDLLITAGGFNTGSNGVYVGGNWTNNVGSTAFVEGTGTVYFNGEDPVNAQLINGETFYNLQNNNYFNQLEIAGNTTVLNNFNTGAAACTTHVTAATMDVQNYLDVSDARLILGATAPDVDAALLQMGGTIEVKDGSLTVNDLADSYLKGDYMITGGTVDITQDTDPGSFVDLKANVTLQNGTMYVRGGTLAFSRWTGIPIPQLNMSGNSILDFTDAGIYVQDDNFTANINAGLIRCNGYIDINTATFQLTGGTMEIYGGGNYSVKHLAGSHFHNLKINPGPAYQVIMLSDIEAHGYFLLSTGTFLTNGYDIEVGL